MEPPKCGATLDSYKPKKPAFLLRYGPYWISLDLNLVEAGGIEPPSESRQRKASTCLVRSLGLVQASPANRTSHIRRQIRGLMPSFLKSPRRVWVHPTSSAIPDFQESLEMRVCRIRST
jgi:hypothetical protein